MDELRNGRKRQVLNSDWIDTTNKKSRADVIPPECSSNNVTESFVTQPVTPFLNNENSLGGCRKKRPAAQIFEIPQCNVFPNKRRETSNSSVSFVHPLPIHTTTNHLEYDNHNTPICSTDYNDDVLLETKNEHAITHLNNISPSAEHTSSKSDGQNVVNKHDCFDIILYRQPNLPDDLEIARKFYSLDNVTKMQSQMVHSILDKKNNLALYNGLTTVDNISPCFSENYAHNVRQPTDNSIAQEIESDDELFHTISEAMQLD